MAEPVLNASDTKIQQTLFHKCCPQLRAATLCVPWAALGHEHCIYPHSGTAGTVKHCRTNYITTLNLYSSLPVLPMLVEFVLWTVSSWDCTLSSKPLSLFFLHSNSILLLIFTLEISISVVVTFSPFEFLFCSSSSYERKIQTWDYFSNSAK